jgi:uncharacterized protein (TIGR02217 family)
MSTVVFPSLPGLSWPFTRTPVWKTGIQTTQSGRELRAAFMSYPIYTWTASYDVLRTASTLTEFQQLLAFFNARSGSYDTFLFNDPDDNTVTAQVFGTGNGTTTQFQLTKSFGGYTEPVPNIVAGATVYVNGTLTTVTLNSPSPGWVTFASAPANGTSLSWTGSYQYVCRFLDDKYDFDRVFTGIYGVKKLAFQSVKP